MPSRKALSSGIGGWGNNNAILGTFRACCASAVSGAARKPTEIVDMKVRGANTCAVMLER